MALTLKKFTTLKNFSMISGWSGYKVSFTKFNVCNDHILQSINFYFKLICI